MRVTQEIDIELDIDQYEELKACATAEGLQLDELLVQAIRNLLNQEEQYAVY